MNPLPFSVPSAIDPDLERLIAQWKSLRRKNNAIPFADDLDLAKLEELEPRLVVLEIFERPQRARFAVVGRDIAERYDGELESRFVDETLPNDPLQYLASQWSATVEAGEPTHFACLKDGPISARDRTGYGRVLLPFWGEGHVSLVLGAFAWPKGHS